MWELRPRDDRAAVEGGRRLSVREHGARLRRPPLHAQGDRSTTAAGAHRPRVRQRRAPGADPLTPGGLGFVEAGLVGTLTLAGLTAHQAVVATLAYRLVSYWLPIPAGGIASCSFVAAIPRTGPADFPRAVSSVSDSPAALPPENRPQSIPTGRSSMDSIIEQAGMLAKSDLSRVALADGPSARERPSSSLRLRAWSAASSCSIVGPGNARSKPQMVKNAIVTMEGVRPGADVHRQPTVMLRREQP